MIVREVAFGSPQYLETLALREAVLRRPLGLELTPEDRAGEERQLHVVALHGAALVGCLVLVPLPANELKMRQVAVAAAWQRQGVGKALVAFAEGLAVARGFSSIVLHARLEAVPFYEARGYRAEGEQFVEVTIPHLRMRKLLPLSRP